MDRGRRVDRLDMAGLRRLVGSISRCLDGVEAQDAGGLVVKTARPIGASWLLDGLWRKLGVASALAEVLGRRRFTTNVERVLFALVAGRVIQPASKLATVEWASCDVVIPGLAAMDKDQVCRAMDLLIEADVDAWVQEAVAGHPQVGRDRQGEVRRRDLLGGLLHEYR
jgi:hypothetical protein